jgi:hypothetical protein
MIEGEAKLQSCSRLYWLTSLFWSQGIICLVLTSFLPLEQLRSCSVRGPATIFLTAKISYLLFPNLTHKTETGTAKGGRLLIAILLNQSNHLANQQQVLGFAVPFATLSILCENAGSKPFCWGKLACFDFSSSKICCTVQWWNWSGKGFNSFNLAEVNRIEERSLARRLWSQRRLVHWNCHALQQNEVVQCLLLWPISVVEV